MSGGEHLKKTKKNNNNKNIQNKDVKLLEAHLQIHLQKQVPTLTL